MALVQFGSPKAVASPEAEIEFMRRLAGLPSVVGHMFGADDDIYVAGLQWLLQLGRTGAV